MKLPLLTDLRVVALIGGLSVTRSEMREEGERED